VGHIRGERRDKAGSNDKSKGKNKENFVRKIPVYELGVVNRHEVVVCQIRPEKNKE